MCSCWTFYFEHKCSRLFCCPVVSRHPLSSLRSPTIRIGDIGDHAATILFVAPLPQRFFGPDYSVDLAAASKCFTQESRRKIAVRGQQRVQGVGRCWIDNRVTRLPVSREDIQALIYVFMGHASNIDEKRCEW